MDRFLRFTQLSKAEQLLICNEFIENRNLFFILLPSDTPYHLSAYQDHTMSYIPLYNENCFKSTPRLELSDLYDSGLPRYINHFESLKYKLHEPIKLDIDATRTLMLLKNTHKISKIYLQTIFEYHFYLMFTDGATVSKKELMIDYEKYNLYFFKKFKSQFKQLDTSSVKEKTIAYLSKSDEAHPIQFALVEFLVKHRRLPNNNLKDLSDLQKLIIAKYKLTSDETSAKFEEKIFPLKTNSIWKYLEQTHLKRLIDFLLYGLLS
jgi:hypothetical protein